MKVIKIIEGFLAGVMMLCLIIVIAISAVEIAAYSDWGYYAKEYEKYEVRYEGGLLDMEEDELMRVTKEMMSYLRGDRENLTIYANVNGEIVDFFDERDKSHMKDVRDLFVGAIQVRAIASLVAVIIFINLCVLLNINGVTKILMSSYIWTLTWVSTVIAVIAIYAVVDFTGAFYKFHGIFFTNYEWVMDENVSRLINMVPEGFFVDTATRIVVIFIVLVITMGLLLYIAKRASKTKQLSRLNEVKLGGTYE